MKFVRFGVLQPQKQVRYGMDLFHAPPCKYGMYAFPDKYIERFLLGATDHPQNSSAKTHWVKDENGNKISYDDFYVKDSYDYDSGRSKIYPQWIIYMKKKNIKANQLSSIYDEKDEKHYMTVLKKPNVFEYNGEIWHHLTEAVEKKPHLILARVGSWVKTDMETYEYALRKTKHIQSRDMMKQYVEEFNLSVTDAIGKDGLDFYTKDHLEVFVERIK
jgi:hypothetical protein